MSSKTKLSPKIKKIGKKDRLKIIDEPGLLVVQPLSWDASKRYGHKSRWCVATGSGVHYKSYTQNNYMVYVLVYDVIDGKRHGDAITKVALLRSKRGRKWRAYDFNDMEFDFTFVKSVLDQQYNFSEILEQHFPTPRKKTPKNNNPFNVGDLVEGISDKILRVKSGSFKRRTYTRFGPRKARKVTRKLKTLPLQCAVIYEIQVSDIIEGKIVKTTATTIHVELKKLNTEYKLLDFLLKNSGITISCPAPAKNFKLLTK